MTETHKSLTQEYAELLSPLVPLAKRAFGPKDQDTPNHAASREYTRLLAEFHGRGGSLIDLAKELGVSYSGLRRRIFTADVPTVRRPRVMSGKVDTAQIDAAAARVSAARDLGTSEYHRQLHAEFVAGVPMNMLARKLGISNAAPLYYGVHSHSKRTLEAETAAETGTAS